MQTHTNSDRKTFSLKSQQFQRAEDLWTSKASNLKVMALQEEVLQVAKKASVVVIEAVTVAVFPEVASAVVTEEASVVVPEVASVVETEEVPVVLVIEVSLNFKRTFYDELF